MKLERKGLRAEMYSERKNVLWGAGANAIPVLFVLAVLDIHIDMFCDYDVKKQGLRICNKMIVAPEYILNNESEYNVIISVDNREYLAEILATLTEFRVSNYIRWRDIEGAYTTMLYFHLETMDKRLIYCIIRDSYVRRIIIYGGENAIKLKLLLQMLDVEVEYLIDDVEYECERCGNTVKPVHSVLYEDEGTFKIVVTSDQEKNCGELERMGLRKGMEYDVVSHYDYTQGFKYILDPNLGYNFWHQKDNNIPGFVTLGKEEKTTLVLLGSSTTDEMVYAFKSWGRLLADKLKCNGYEVKILNGACSGYRSSQELVKLIRDVLPMRPNIIIDYTGCNDAMIDSNSQYPFIHEYQKDIFSRISEQFLDSEWETISSEKFTLGTPDQRPRWERFIDNIKVMESICKNFGILYKPFLQPCIITKDNSIQEKEIRMHWGYSIEFYDEMEAFYKNVISAKVEAIEDITELFDYEEDVYIDMCHVNERGNEIIAQYMYEYLTREGLIKK